MITIIPIEPLSEEHGMLIVQAFNKHFVDGGGQTDGTGYGDPVVGADWGYYSDGCGDGNSRGSKCPEEWMIDESNRALTGGQNKETLRDKKMR